ncbi:hypothetical protein [Parafrankia sp. BMG5.11]|uniref:hypothetical protein n=1 Tax=Parafrankia sp. BMG5.11 TaxID=222540 RepID=UPI00103E4C44|nr:hypothetical protein [Parafrankia sp. BMG5.11]TCJ34520.1 hypothetical protein E0504_32780 [Parafrankia sp. BMG5.11]
MPHPDQSRDFLAIGNVMVAIDDHGYGMTSVAIRTLKDPLALAITLNQEAIFEADVRYPDPPVVDLGGSLRPGSAYRPVPCLCGGATAIERPRGIARILRRLRRR